MSVLIPSPVYEYSHERIAKYSAPAVSWPIASDSGVLLFLRSVSKTIKGRAACCFDAGSSVLYPCSCLSKQGKRRPEEVVTGRSKPSSSNLVRIFESPCRKRASLISPEIFVPKLLAL